MVSYFLDAPTARVLITRSASSFDGLKYTFGLGGIGTEVAKRGAGFGMRVTATRRGDDPGPDYVERVGKSADLHCQQTATISYC